jgi:hypothetical protein
VHDCGTIFHEYVNWVDNSDENQNCTKQCPINNLPCSNGVCIHISKFCDGHIDCQNDESFCTDKAQCKNLKCDYECKSTPHGPHCYCPPNHNIVNGTKCVMQKECIENISENGDVCDQLCLNVKGRNKCSCVNGYELKNHKCYGINGKPVQLNYHPYILFFLALLRSLKSVFKKKTNNPLYNLEPPTEPTSLLILTPNEILKINLPSDKSTDSDGVTQNKNPVNLTQVLKRNKLIAMEVNFWNHTVCVLENIIDIFCYNISNFSDAWKLPVPDFIPECELQKYL